MTKSLRCPPPPYEYQRWLSEKRREPIDLGDGRVGVRSRKGKLSVKQAAQFLRSCGRAVTPAELSDLAASGDDGPKCFWYRAIEPVYLMEDLRAWAKCAG